MTWDYRVVRYPDDTLGIHEAYYDRETKEVIMITEDAVGIVAESIKGLREESIRMILAVHKPIIDLEEFDAKITLASEKGGERL